MFMKRFYKLFLWLLLIEVVYQLLIPNGVSWWMSVIRGIAIATFLTLLVMGMLFIRDKLAGKWNKESEAKGSGNRDD